MTEEEQPEQTGQRRVSKRTFLAQVSAESDIPQRVVNLVYDTIIDELLETMRRGDALMLTGFGKFHPQAHKGHRVQFADSGSKAIDDYFVLKFSATRSVNKSLLEAPRAEHAELGALFSTDPEDADEADDTEFDAEPVSRPKTTPKRRPKPDSAVAQAAAATQSSRSFKRAQTKAERDALRPPVHKRAI